MYGALIVFLISLVTGAITVVGADAQRLAPDRFAPAATAMADFPPPPTVAGAPVPAEASPRNRAPLARVLAGTVVGGVLGAAAGAGIGAAMGAGESDAGFISASAALAVLGAGTLSPVGAAIGARQGAAVEGSKPGLGRLTLYSFATALAGGILANRVGEAFESPDSMTSWYAGAGLGLATHWVLTAVLAQRAPAGAERD